MKVLRIEQKPKRRLSAMELDSWLTHRQMHLMTMRVNEHNSRVMKANEQAAKKAAANTKDYVI